jgi:hypothetical protein
MFLGTKKNSTQEVANVTRIQELWLHARDFCNKGVGTSAFSTNGSSSERSA